MKKTLKIGILILAVAGLFAIESKAQRATDLYGAPWALSLGQCGLKAGTTSVTNGPYDIRIFDGIGTIFITVSTNGTPTQGPTAVTGQLYGSVDQTNYTVVPYALSSQTTINYTNNWYGTNGLTAANVFLSHGAITFPTASSAGWATPYVIPYLYTNTAAIPLTNLVTQIGFNIADAPRYLYWVSGSGASTNYMTTQVMLGATHSGQLY